MGSMDREPVSEEHVSRVKVDDSAYRSGSLRGSRTEFFTSGTLGLWDVWNRSEAQMMSGCQDESSMMLVNPDFILGGGGWSCSDVL